MKSAAFALGPRAHDTSCAPSKSESLFPSVLWKTAIKPPWCSRPKARTVLPPVPDPQAGEPDVGLGKLTPVGELWQCNHSRLSVACLGGKGFDYIESASLAVLLWVLHVSGYRIPFLVGSSLDQRLFNS